MQMCVAPERASVPFSSGPAPATIVGSRLILTAALWVHCVAALTGAPRAGDSSGRRWLQGRRGTAWQSNKM